MARRPVRRPKPRAAHRGLRKVETDHGAGMAPSEVQAARALFWQNVVREFLTELATLSALKPAGDGAAAASSPEPAGEGPRYDPALFDGRMAVVTVHGDRIPVAEVSLLLAAGAVDPAQRELSMAVECSVFQIRTPDGHVFTLPLQQIATIHAMSPELLQRLNKRARPRREREEGGSGPVPFGFAAFTSLARGITPTPSLPGRAPEHPQE